MTTVLKEANNYYLQLVIEFPPRPIKNNEELMATQNRVHYILDQGILQPEDLEEYNLSPQDFLEIFNSEKVILDVLQGKRKMTPSETIKLSKFGNLLI